MITLSKIKLPIAGIEELRLDAAAEGFRFLDTLVEDWASGENRFNGRGEALFAAFADGVLVAVGGLNRDPFENNPAVGRIRRVYVRGAWRNQGVGRALVEHLIAEARKHFSIVRLRAESADAARLYEHIGFETIDDPNATHLLHFSKLDG